MYPSRGNAAYGQQPYGSQQPYGQISGSGYSANPVGGGHEGGSRSSSIMGAPQEADMSGYRSQSLHAQYGGQYTSVYGTASMSSVQQLSGVAGQGVGSSGIQGRSGYASGPADSSKFPSAGLGSSLGSNNEDFLSSSNLGYGYKGDQYPPGKGSDYASVDRRLYGEHQSSLFGRDLQNESARRYTDISAHGYQKQSEMLDHDDQAALLRKQQMLTAQSLQTGQDMRPVDYLAARGASVRHVPQDLSPYGGRMDADPRNLSILGSSPYAGQHPPSALGGAPRRNVDNLIYAQGSSSSGYGVGLPPGRDYIAAKGLHGTPLESDYSGSLLARSAHPSAKDERRNDRDAFHREPDTREVYPFCLVDAERDYLSINKRYPRLSISPEFSKVIWYWPKENLNISFHTPVSFKHDLVEVGGKTEQKELSTEPGTEEAGKAKHGTVWNAKVILMSGISNDALEELCNEKSTEGRIAHFNNLLRFAVIRKDRSFMTIGGPWNVAVDGGDPAVDGSCLIHTALRYVKDMAQLDLHNCQHWNRFLEIHYDRVGKDGLFSHKEITVLFIPDLSACLPSVDEWQKQWIAYKKNLTEKERRLALKKEKSIVKEEVTQGMAGKPSPLKSEKYVGSAKDIKVEDFQGNNEKDKKEGLDNMDCEVATDISKDGLIRGDQNESLKSVAEQNEEETAASGKEEEMKGNKMSGGNNKNEKTDSSEIKVVQKTGKKRVVKKTMKGKVAVKKGTSGNTSKCQEKLEELDTVNKQNISEAIEQQNVTSAGSGGVKTFVRKKTVKRVPVGKIIQKDETTSNDSAQNEKKPKEEAESQEGELKRKNEPGKETGTRKIVKRKIVRRVPKKKVIEGEDKSVSVSKQDKMVEENTVTQHVKEVEDAKIQIKNVEQHPIGVSKFESEVGVNDVGKELEDGHDEIIGGRSVEEDIKGRESDSKSNKDKEVRKQKESNNHDQDGKKGESKDDKEKKTKYDSDRSLSKEVRKKEKSEEPPQHPGFFLQTKWSKESKMRLMTLSLDGLLDYNDKDIAESTFEKLYIRCVIKKNKRKRESNENPDNDKEKSSQKRPKIVEGPPQNNDTDELKTIKSEIPDSGKTLAKDGGSVAEQGKVTVETVRIAFERISNGKRPFELHSNGGSNSEQTENLAEASSVDAKPEEPDTDANKEKKSLPADHEKSIEKSEKKDVKDETDKKLDAAREQVVDKELLQAFRFFDRNRVGYIKVEDMRLILHNLGRFLSHRDVKEMVTFALLESNNPRDNRIFYKKLVRLSDI
ncbi:hypothetical protein QJS10_CPA06g00457 [Acorus calamus]|uniref:EF-hand domain-containing protein n=1 Tax=Acorus calamus TaxID=4465 RepID=A0AAV9EM15_ACOCL|nr:hypothetical protein QJS10_CPA06g00457 [Acorus calamus]